MMRNSGAGIELHVLLQKLSFTGEPIDSETATFAETVFGHPVCSMYGTTEIGVILVNYPGAKDFTVKPGSLGKPIPGGKFRFRTPRPPCAPGLSVRLKVWRRDAWIPTKDLGRVDEDDYFYHAGRADDVIISAGWTMSAVEIEDAILKHPQVQEAAAIGVPDALRGQVVKAFVVASRDGDERLSKKYSSSCARDSARTSIRATLHLSPSCRKLPQARFTAKCCASASSLHWRLLPTLPPIDSTIEENTWKC